MVTLEGMLAPTMPTLARAGTETGMLRLKAESKLKLTSMSTSGYVSSVGLHGH